MFGTKLDRLKRKSVGFLNTFTAVVEGLQEANIEASKRIEDNTLKIRKIAIESEELTILQVANKKIIENVSKMIQ